jgi:hypothetical protein
VKRVISSIHLILNIVMLIAVIAEFFFAGMGVFHVASFAIHKATGEFITYASLLLLLLSLVGRLTRTRILLSALLVVLMIIQSLLVHVPMPVVSALHPVNGLAIIGVIVFLLLKGLKKAQG